MKTNFYETPQLSALEFKVEHGFAASETGENWYDTDAGWNDQFGFNTDFDDTWG